MDPIVHTTKPDKDSLPGFFEPKETLRLDKPSTVKTLPGIDPQSAVVFENVLSTDECQNC